MEDTPNRCQLQQFPSPIIKTKVNWDEDLIQFTDSAQEDRSRRLSIGGVVLPAVPKHSSTPFRPKESFLPQTPFQGPGDDTMENIFYTPMCPQTYSNRGSTNGTNITDSKNTREPHREQDENQERSETSDITSRNLRKSHCLIQDQNREDSVGKFIGEEDLVDCVFHLCDIEKAGRVPVSRIIDYLRHTTTNPVAPNESMEKLDGLSSLLDPKGEDALVDLETYQTHMRNWIEEIRKYDIMQRRTRSNRLSSADHSDYDLLNASYTTISSLEGCGGEASFNLDAAELMTSVVELQKSSKKLGEQNQKLRHQVDSADEANALLSLENDNLKKQLKSMQQQTTSRHNQLVDEIEELKCALGVAEKENRRGEHRRGQLEREGQNMQARVEGLQEQLNKAAQEVETLQQENKDVAMTLRLQKECCGELEATTLSLQAQLEEHQEKQREMSVLVQEYSCTIQALRAEKHQLEEQLLQVQQDLARYRVERRMQLDTDDLDPAGVAVSPLSALHHSLHAELLDASGMLPSPFCGNNSYKVQEDEEEDNPDEEDEPQQGSSTGGSMSTFSLEHFKLIAAQLVSQFTNHIQRNNNNKIEVSSQQKTRHPSELCDEMHSFQDKLDWLTQAKRAADRRVAQLTGTVSRLRTEREDLVREHQQQLQQVLDQVVGQKKDNQMLELVAAIQDRTSQVHDLQKQVSSLEDQLTESTNEVHTLAAALRLEMDARSRIAASLEDVERKACEAEDCLRMLQIQLEDKKQTADVVEGTSEMTSPEGLKEKTTPVREPESLLKLRPCQLFSDWPPVSPAPVLRSRHLSTSCLDLAFTSSLFDKMASTVGTQTDLPRSPNSQLQPNAPITSTAVGKECVENAVQTLPFLILTVDNQTQTEQTTIAGKSVEVQTDSKTFVAETTQTAGVEEIEAAMQTDEVNTCDSCVGTEEYTEDQIAQTDSCLTSFQMSMEDPIGQNDGMFNPIKSCIKLDGSTQHGEFVVSRQKQLPMLAVLRVVVCILAVVGFVFIITSSRQSRSQVEAWTFLEDVLAPYVTLRHVSRPPF
ncbi:CCDC155 [Branchiostoma lanceolatum]|uniref:CCDC155 protein n=1 Tax=Branchiostoma lanceolatum TaxID=7740 RepID=A0A8K0ES37_BRALA|nr:CCDC155 [Branchiostoma lanceolatum]